MLFRSGRLTVVVEKEWKRMREREGETKEERETGRLTVVLEKDVKRMRESERERQGGW